MSAIGTTSPSSALLETGAQPPPHKIDFAVHAHDLAEAAGRFVQAGLARAVHGSKFWQRRLNGPAPDRILVHPRCFYRKSMAEAELLIMGRFRLPGGDATARDGSPFFVTPPSELWSESLHSFHWLRHFDAAGSQPVQEHLRQLIAHWVRSYGSWHELSWRPHVLARRLMTWASFGRLILLHADVLFRSRVLLSMARQARHLERTAHTADPGIPRLTAVIGLVQSGICLPDGDARLARGLHLLAEQLGEQILADGGHVSRDPETILGVASDLLAIVDAMTQRDLIVPVTIRRTLDRMMPMIRFMQHGDGRFALFNGGGESLDGWPQTLLNYDTGHNRTPQHAHSSAYHRVDCGKTRMIADVGIAPPGLLSTGAHAGCLSFELSADTERIIVNCGASQLKGSEWVRAMRATAAHSTLTVADTSSAHIPAGWVTARLLGPRLIDGPTQVEAKRRESEDGVHLEACHNGYVAAFGLMHERRWFVSHDGADVRGEDRLVPSKDSVSPASYVVRFHLHPGVKVVRMLDGRSILLTLPSGDTWRFGADAALELADSVYLGDPAAIRKTHQIVVYGVTATGGATIKWALRKIAGIDRDLLVN